MLFLPTITRASRSPRGRLPLDRYSALVASLVAALGYQAVAARPAHASSVVHPRIDVLAALQSGLPAAGPTDGAPSPAAAIGVQLAGDQAALNQTQAQAEALASRLRQQAVTAFVDGGSPSTPAPDGGYETIVRNQYLAIVTSSEQSSLRRLEAARAALRADQARLEADELQGQAVVAAAVNGQAIAASSGADQSSGPLDIKGPADFALALVKALGDPASSPNIEAIVAWCQREGGGWNNVAQHNPLNTSMKMPGSHGINGDGVQSYTSWSQGLTATVATLNGGAYQGILRALSAGNSVSAVENAVADSPWGTHF